MSGSRVGDGGAPDDAARPACGSRHDVVPDAWTPNEAAARDLTDTGRTTRILGVSRRCFQRWRDEGRITVPKEGQDATEVPA